MAQRPEKKSGLEKGKIPENHRPQSPECSTPTALPMVWIAEKETNPPHHPLLNLPSHDAASRKGILPENRYWTKAGINDLTKGISDDRIHTDAGR